MQYIGKGEVAFIVRLNCQEKRSKKKDAILTCTHFQSLDLVSQCDAKCVFIKQITKKYNTIEEYKFIFLKERFFYLGILYPDYLHQELNYA